MIGNILFYKTINSQVNMVWYCYDINLSRWVNHFNIVRNPRWFSPTPRHSTDCRLDSGVKYFATIRHNPFYILFSIFYRLFYILYRGDQQGFPVWRCFFHTSMSWNSSVRTRHRFLYPCFSDFDSLQISLYIFHDNIF